MKKLLFILSFMSIAAICSYAQPGGDEMRDLERNPELRKKIESYRTAFYTEHLELSPTEAQSFWPVFQEMNQRMRELKKQYKPRQNKADRANMSEVEIRAELKKHFEMKRKALTLEEEYMNKFLEILPAKKVVMLPKLDREFKKKILRELRQRRTEEQRERRF